MADEIPLYRVLDTDECAIKIDKLDDNAVPVTTPRDFICARAKMDFTGVEKAALVAMK